MRITDTSVYDGPNLYVQYPAIRHRLDLEALADWPVKRLGAPFLDGLLEYLPGLNDLNYSSVSRDSFMRRLREDESIRMSHVMEGAAIALQIQVGVTVSSGKTLTTSEGRVFDVVYEYEEPQVGLAAGVLALVLLNHLVPQKLIEPGARNPEFDFAGALEAFNRFAERLLPGASVRALAQTARRRGIPCIRLDEPSHIQLGYGRHRRRIWGSETYLNSRAAAELARDKEKSIRILADLGLPVPRQRVVSDIEEAVETAELLGYPVVVKPVHSDGGRAVSVNLSEADAVRTAFRQAREHGRRIIVEACVDGVDHRMFVIEGAVAAVSKRIPGHVVGDGVKTVEQLVKEVNRDPRRGDGHQRELTRLRLDPEAHRLLATMGYSEDTVPAAGKVVYLRGAANLSRGGTAVDVTDIVHPDNREMAAKAVEGLGLRVAGVDFLTTDISRSYKDIGGIICEVNNAPGFRAHQTPYEGIPRDVAARVLDLLFPHGKAARIPIGAITGTNGKTTTARMVAHILRLAGYTVGLATTSGAYVDGKLIEKGDMAGPWAARRLLQEPRIDAAVFETARGGLIHNGMGYDRCTVGTVLEVANDHIGMDGIMSLEDMAKVKRIVVGAAEDTAVLNADDPLCVEMASYTNARHLCYVTERTDNPIVDAHMASGGRAVRLEDGPEGPIIVLYNEQHRIPVLSAAQIPATLGGAAHHNVHNAMFAVATVHGMGVMPDMIRRGLREYTCTFEMAPGRMNFYDGHPFKVMVDWAHNPSAIEAMRRVIESISIEGQRLCTLSAAGNRVDEHFAEMGRTAAGLFDHYILCSWDDLRGRELDEVPRLIRDALLANGVAEANITVVPEEERAVDTALRMARAGDFLTLFIHDVDRAWNQVTTFVPDASQWRGATSAWSTSS